MKKIVSLILTMLLCAAICVPAFATDNEEYGEEIVAEMYYCATAESLTGHIWLYFENISEKEIKVGYVTLAPGETTSVGSLRNTRTDGGGTYYNGEAFMSGYKPSVTGATVSLKKSLTESELNTVSEEIKSMNLYILVGFNCGDFATRVWNSVSSRKIVHLCLPVITLIELVFMGGSFGAVKMNVPDISRCFKQTDGGIKQASMSSFDLPCI